MKYDGIRIFITGENIYPDFNLVDYAIGFDYLDFGDRYFRRPLYLGTGYEDDWIKAINKHLCIDFNSYHKRKFCNFVYSNSNADKKREEFFRLLGAYKTVDLGGRYLNNIGKCVENKLSFQQQYKFSIAFENASAPGYTTEKLMQAFAAGTIPIYWGNPLIAEEFNTKAFINCHDYNSFEDVIEIVKKVDNDDSLYYSYLKEPACTHTQFEMAQKTLDDYEKFVLHIFQQPYEKAFRRNRSLAGWMYEYEKQMKVQLMELDMRKMTLPTLLKINARFAKRKMQDLIRGIKS